MSEKAFKKFPELVADPTTNEQKIQVWRGDTAQNIKQEMTKVNDECKIILDELERGCYPTQKDVFDVMFKLVEKIPKALLEALEK